MDVISWGEIEMEPEVRAWYSSLDWRAEGHVEFYLRLLAEEGVLLGEPYTRRLVGKLRELRFRLQREAIRITYWIAPGRRIILLTVFRKTRMRERAEVNRALQAMAKCIREGHTKEEHGL